MGTIEENRSKSVSEGQIVACLLSLTGPRLNGYRKCCYVEWYENRSKTVWEQRRLRERGRFGNRRVVIDEGDKLKVHHILA